ncbi:hypothetical protein ACFIQG_18315 [Comamonas odontotermitis]|uniref:hypothetical protein n=1 Tax=Comamonas odontotermitis TaxID=379895 RepID=UPI00366F7817
MNLDLTEEEFQLIKKRRADEAAARQMEEFRMSVAETAAQFFRYLDNVGMGPSFSEFVNGFGYEGDQQKLVYECVLQVRGVLWK